MEWDYFSGGFKRVPWMNFLLMMSHFCPAALYQPVNSQGSGPVMRTVILYPTEQALSTLDKMVAPRQLISGCCCRGMFLASHLIQGSAPHYRACEGQGAGMGLSRQVDISGSFARTPQHISSSRTSGVGANVSTRADGQASVPTALDRTRPLAWQLLASQPDVALPGTSWRGRCLPLAASCGNMCVCIQTVEERSNHVTYCNTKCIFGTKLSWCW